MLDTDNNINNNNSISEHHSPPPQKQFDPNYTPIITFKDLIHFKDDIIKSLNEFQSTLKKYFVSQFSDFNNKLTSLSNEQNIHKEQLSSLFSYKIDTTKLDKIESLSSFLTTAREQLITHEIKLATCERDISNVCYKYDKIFIDNLTIPGTIGQCCKYRNLREYLVNNTDQISNLNNNITKAAIDFKAYKKKVDTIIKQLSVQIESNKTFCVDHMNATVATKDIQIERNKEEMLFMIEGLKIENNKQTKMLLEQSQQLKNEFDMFNQNKTEILNELNNMINKTKDINSILTYDYGVIKKEIKETKKAIVDIANLFNNNNNNGNNNKSKDKIKNDIIANFNSTIAYLIKQMANEQSKHLIDNNNSQDKIESYIKKYINGQVSLGAIMQPKRRRTENNVFQCGLTPSNINVQLKSTNTEDNEEQHYPIRRTVSMHRKTYSATSNLFKNLYKQNPFSPKEYLNNNIIEEDELLMNTPINESEQDNTNNNNHNSKHREIFEYANTKCVEKATNISHEITPQLNNDIESIATTDMFTSYSKIERNPLQNKLINNINKEEIKTIKSVDSDKSDMKIKSKFHNKNNTNTHNKFDTNLKTIPKRFASASPLSKHFTKSKNKSTSLIDKQISNWKEETTTTILSKLHKTKSFLTPKTNIQNPFSTSKSNKNAYISRNMYLSNDDLNNIEDIPLIPKSQCTFRLDSSRSPLENRVIEFEFFTKKKFDELVSEIKKYLPIHFNSHLKNYDIVNKNLERKINKQHFLSETNILSSSANFFPQMDVLNKTYKQQQQSRKIVNAFVSPTASANTTKVKYNNYKIFKKAKNLSQNDINSNINNNSTRVSVITDKVKKQRRPKVFVSCVLTNSPKKTVNS